MNPWFETVCAVLVALLGVLLGRMFSKVQRPYWTLGYFLPLLLIAILATARCIDSLVFVPPFSWMAAGRIRFFILSLAVTMGLITPLSRLPHKFEKFTICILMTVVVVWFSFMPFLFPALLKDYLANLRTRLDSSGICYQSTDYTCGPAAAVTALEKLGLSADEGEIAILSHSTPVTGTLPACLSNAIQTRYGSEGVKCQYRHFDSIDQLRDAGITLVVVKEAFLSDHCIAVLGVSDQTVTVADPAWGKRLMSYKQFGKIWRFSGIVLKRDEPQNI